MNIDLPPNFDMTNPHKELVLCPSCKKYQHFTFNRVKRCMWCDGCGTKYHFSHIDLKACEAKPYCQASMDYPNKLRERYGPPKYLRIYNHWHDNPDYTTADLWRRWYWDICSYNTIQRYIRCIKKDLEGL